MFEAIFSWETLRWVMWVVYFPVCVFLMVIVLLQKGKGTSFAGAFGIGPGSDAVFGPRASRSLPVRLTYISAGLFLVLALGLSAVEGKVGKGSAPQKVAVDEIQGVPESEALNEMGLGSAYSNDSTPKDAPSSDDGTAGVPAAPEDESSAPAVTVEPKPAAEASSTLGSEPSHDATPPVQNDKGAEAEQESSGDES